MPGFDRTGPRGTGPMTGGRRGLCGTRSAGRGGGQGFGRGMGRGFGQGRGRGFGIGMGRGFGRSAWAPDYYDVPYSSTPTMSRDQEIDFLQNQAQALREELEEIEARMSQMEKKEN